MPGVTPGGAQGLSVCVRDKTGLAANKASILSAGALSSPRDIYDCHGYRVAFNS